LVAHNLTMKSLFKTLLLLLVMFTASTLYVKAQKSGNSSLIFKKLDDLPYILEWPATVTDGVNIYAINGYTPNGAESRRSYSRDALAFDPQSDEWITLNNNAGAKIQSSAAYLPSNGHIYLFGGIILATNKIYQDVETLDVKTGEIKELGIHSRIPVTYGYASEWKGLIYLYGGTEAGNHTTSSVYSFDPKTADFTKLANMPEGLQTAGTIVNGTLYTFGGFNGFLNKQSADINAYDIKTDTWKTVAKLPQTVSANSVAVCGDLVFIVGDYNKETFLGYYNTRTNNFVKLNSNMSGHRAGGAAIINNTLYVFGGKGDPGSISGGYKTMQSADIGDILKMEAGNK